MSNENGFWLTAPTFASLGSTSEATQATAPSKTSGLTPRPRNPRMQQLLGEAPRVETAEEITAKLRRSLTDEKDGHSSDDNAVGSLGFYPEGD